MAERRVPLPSDGRARSVGIWLLAILGASAASLVGSMLAPFVPLDPTESEPAALLSYAVGYACASGVVLFVAPLAPSDTRTAVASCAVAAVTLAAIALVAGAPSALAASVVLAALLALGTAGGAAIGSRIQHAGHLSIVAIVSSVADVASVVSPGGPSHEIADSPALLSVLALSWPMIGTARIEPLLGVGDVAFVSLYVAAAVKHRLSLSRTLVALAVALAVTALVVAALALPVPALPFLGAAMLVAHPEARLPPAAERRRALAALAVFLLLFGALVLVRWSG